MLVGVIVYFFAIQVCLGRTIPSFEANDGERAGAVNEIRGDAIVHVARTIETKEPGRGMQVYTSPGLDGYLTAGSGNNGKNDPSLQEWLGDKRTWYGARTRTYYNSQNIDYQQKDNNFGQSYGQGYGQGYGPFMGGPQGYPLGRPPSNFFELLFLPMFTIFNMSGTSPQRGYNPMGPTG